MWNIDMTKQSLLQKHQSKQKKRSKSFTPEEYHTIINFLDEEVPCGLQQKFYQIFSVEPETTERQLIVCFNIS